MPDMKNLTFSRMASVFLGVFALFILIHSHTWAAGPTIIDHSCTDLTQIPESAINQAKAGLHIAYGHTSHGSQVTTGMSGLVNFINNGGLGLSLPHDFFAWNNGGTGGALDLHDYFRSGDLGNPDRYTWAQRTREYLDDPANSDVNVIIWSWCGQAATSIANIDIYLDLMEGLIADYPNVNFVFMTGHLNGGGADGILNLANNHIRAHCLANSRILYDFADIESYDPDGQVNYMELLATDNCDYDSDGNGTRDRNWATDWQDSHTEGFDWYSCSSAHSQPLNANRKAYAAWWLWARLAGWGECLPGPSELSATADSPNLRVELTWIDNSSDPDEDSFIVQRNVNGGDWNNSYATLEPGTTSYTDSGLEPGTYCYRVIAHLDDDGSGNPCDSYPSNVVESVIVSTDPPADPSNLIASVASPDSISLGWIDNSDSETGFIIQRQVDGGEWNDNYATVGADSTSYNDQGLEAGYYNYRVVAYNEYGNSDPSNESGCNIIDLPSPPTNLQASGNSVEGTVLLTWTASTSPDLRGYIIQRLVDGGAWDENYVTTGLICSYIDVDLPDGTYTYRVVAFNDNGNSGPSNEASAVISTEVPADPLDLQSQLSGFDIALTWIDDSDNEESFILERSMDEGSFAILATLPADTESYSDNDLPPLHTYTYRVKARNNFGDSGYSNETEEYIAEEQYTITLKQGVNGYQGCRDSYLDSNHPDTNYGDTYYKHVLNDPKCNLAVSFDLPPEVMGKKILNAALVFYCWSVSGYQTGQYLDLYRITQEWDESTATWNERTGGNQWIPPGGAFDPQLLDHSLIPNSSYYPEFDITSLVQEWADGGYDGNFGVLLKNDSVVDTGIKASEYSEYGRPYLEITYTNKLPCPTDYDQDGDVDGSDLAAFAIAFDEDCLNEFAAAFGR